MTQPAISSEEIELKWAELNADDGDIRVMAMLNELLELRKTTPVTVPGEQTTDTQAFSVAMSDDIEPDTPTHETDYESVLNHLRNISHEDLDDAYAGPCPSCGGKQIYDRSFPRKGRPIMCVNIKCELGNEPKVEQREVEGRFHWCEFCGKTTSHAASSACLNCGTLDHAKTVPGEQRGNICHSLSPKKERCTKEDGHEGHWHIGMRSRWTTKEQHPDSPTGEQREVCACEGKIKHFNFHSLESCGVEPKVEQRGDTPKPVDSNEVVTKRNQLEAQPLPAATTVDEIITSLYRRFKDWNKRGFGPDDVTWCEVKADILQLLAHSNPVESNGWVEKDKIKIFVQKAISGGASRAYFEREGNEILDKLERK